MSETFEAILGQKRGVFGGSGFRVKTGNSFRHEKESVFRISTMQQKQQKQHLFLRETKVYFLYFIIKSLCYLLYI